MKTTRIKQKRLVAALLAVLMAALLCGCSNGGNNASSDPTDTPSASIPTESSVPVTEEPAPTPAPTEWPAADETPRPTETPEPTEVPGPTVDPNFPYMLYVEKGSFTLTIYGIGEDGQYSEVVASYRISHGGNRTPAGEFVLTKTREQWHGFSGGENGYAQYAILFNTAANPGRYTGLFIHGPMYGSENPNHLWPKYYDGEKYIGGENTQGCLRMVVEAAKFIYENCPPGTRLVIVNGSPLGTTSPDVPPREGRHDPTDPDAADWP